MSIACLSIAMGLILSIESGLAKFNCGSRICLFDPKAFHFDRAIMKEGKEVLIAI